MLEQEIVPLRKQIRIIDESFELISTAEEQKTLLKEDVKSLEKQAEDLDKYRQKIIDDSQKLPEALRRLNNLMIENADSEIQENKRLLAVKKRSLTLVSGKLQKKLEFALGSNFSEEEKTGYFDQLKEQRKEIERKIELIQGKKEALVRIFNAQYEAEQMADIHSVPVLTEELTKQILGNTDNNDSVI